MNKQMIMVLVGMLLISVVSAQMMCEDTCYSGETYFINATESFDHWSFVGNENNMSEDYFNITQDPDTYLINVTLNNYMKADSFELIFFNQETEIITEHHYSSGGGGSSSSKTKYVDKIEYVPYEVPVEKIVEKEVEKIVEVPSDDSLLKYWRWMVSILVTGLILGFYFRYFFKKTG